MTDPIPSPASPVSSRTLLALTEALEHTFDASAWATLGLALDMPQLGDPEARLQESLRLRDDDYGYFIAQFLKHLQAEQPGALHDIACLPHVTAWLDSNAPEAAQALGTGQHHADLSRKPVPASEAVEPPLQDAQGAPSTRLHGGVGDLHAALHGYLRDVCSRAGLSLTDDATIAQLFESARSRHPVLVALDHDQPRIGNALSSLAESITGLSSWQNVASGAGQHQASMEEAEARLAVALMRTLFDYLQARLPADPARAPIT